MRRREWRELWHAEIRMPAMEQSCDGDKMEGLYQNAAEEGGRAD